MTGRAPEQEISGEARSRPESPLVRYLAVSLLVGAAYYLGARLGLIMSVVEHNVTPLWPPTGIAVAAFLVLGRSLWPAVAVAAFAVNLPISENVAAAAVTAVGNLAGPLLAVYLLNRVGFRRQLDRQRDALAIVFLGALASMTVSASIGAGTLVVSDAIPSADLLEAWVVWWTGDAMGVLSVTPFLLSLPLCWERRWVQPGRWVEVFTLLAVVAGVTAWASTSHLNVLVLVLPALGWAAWRLGLRGAAPAALVASLIATWSAARGVGPFANGSLFEDMLTLQAFNACVALTSFFLAAILSEERSEAERQLNQEHQIAETLQRSLLPDRLPEIPGVDLAARYVPASSDVQIGGDWYDVVQLPGGLIGLAIGDVAGHGLPAAANMGQIRMAVRAYALQDPSPSSVMCGVHQLMTHLPVTEMVTLIYLVFDPGTGILRYANAGHPPVLVIADGESVFLEGVSSPPVGVTAEARYDEATYVLRPGATLLLYTDGLVERRGVSIQVGLDRLAVGALENAESGLENLCDRLLSSRVGDGVVADDIAVVAMRVASLVERPLSLTLSAEPRMLVQVRAALRRWLRESSVPDTDGHDVLVACGEACANVVQHAYGATPGELVVHAQVEDGLLELTVRDTGDWRPAADRGGGWGLQLIESLMDSVDVERGPDGTVVRMRRRIGGTP